MPPLVTPPRPRRDTPPLPRDAFDTGTAGMLESLSSDESSEPSLPGAESSDRSSSDSSKSESGLTSRTTVGPFLACWAGGGANDTFLLPEDSAGELAYPSPAGCSLPLKLLHPTGLVIEGLFKIGLSIDGVLRALGGPDVEAAGPGPFLATILNDLPFNASFPLARVTLALARIGLVGVMATQARLEELVASLVACLCALGAGFSA
jgi:hypothetical protein